MTSPYIGEIHMGGYNFAPKLYAYCNGQILPISSFPALFSVLGTTYGGNGSSTFGLPDLRGRTPIGWGQGPGLSIYVPGEAAGQENVTLLTSEMPGHSHAMAGVTTTGTTRDPRGNTLAASTQNHYSTAPPNTGLDAAAMGTAGGGLAHTNLPPYLAINFYIALVGAFPSRN